MKNLKLLLLSCVLIVLALFASPALAQDVVVTTPIVGGIPSWQSQLLMAMVSFMSAVMTIALPVILKHYLHRSKVAAELVTDEMVDRIVTQSVDWAEEQGHKFANKANRVTSSEKLDIATKFVLAQLNERKLPDKGADWVKNRIEAKIGEKRDSTLSLTSPKVADVGTVDPSPGQ